METMGTDEMPWQAESCFSRLLPQFAYKPSYFKPDPWHTVNLGTGKSWVASCLVLLLPLFAGRSIPERLASMSTAYYNFCNTSATRAIIQQIGFASRGLQHAIYFEQSRSIDGLGFLGLKYMAIGVYYRVYTKVVL